MIKQKEFEQINRSCGLMSPTKAIASGNHKMPMSHVILNITSATDCPSDKLGYCHCSIQCYAKLEEIRWKTVRNNRQIIQQFFRDCTYEQLRDLVFGYINLYQLEYPITHLRVNECGDFPNQKWVQWIDELAKELSGSGIVIYCWTARKDLDFSNVSFIVNASNVGVKHSSRLFLATKQEVFDRLEVGKHEHKCPGNCRICNVCRSKNDITKVYCRMHSSKARV